MGKRRQQQDPGEPSFCSLPVNHSEKLAAVHLGGAVRSK